MEDLNVKGMMKNHCLAGAISDVGWGELKRQLGYKLSQGIVCVDRWYPSSKLCHKCGHKQSLALKDRVWECEACHAVHDRDENATQNILAQGRKIVTATLAVYSFITSNRYRQFSREVTPQETGSLAGHTAQLNRSRIEEPMKSFSNESVNAQL